MRVYRGWAACPGTCGEWIQGAKNGTPFLIDCPVNRYVEVETRCTDISPEHEFKHELMPWGGKDSSRKQVNLRFPQEKTKTARALTLLQERFELSLDGEVTFLKELPTGKGMASSTADISAVLAAVLSSLDIPWEPEDIARIALAIEPSDPVMFPGITEFAHQDGKYVRELGVNVPAQLLILDGGGSLDTEQFNARADLQAHYRKHEATIRKALAVFYEGMASSDLEKLAYGSTLSALCNQEINPKPYARVWLSFVRKMGGLGMIAAHSGTLLAGVFPMNISPAEKVKIFEKACEELAVPSLEWVETRNGGLRVFTLEKELSEPRDLTGGK